MANPTGIINGSKVLLKTFVGGQQVVVGGLLTNTSNYNNELIDISNKSDPDFRYFLEGEGEQSLDHSCDCLFSSDAAYQLIRTRWQTKTIDAYIVDYGDKSEQYDFAVSSLGDNANKNEAANTSITLTSSGEIGRLQPDRLAIDTNTDLAIDTNGDYAYG